MTLATLIRCIAITGLFVAQATVVTEGQGAPVDYQRAERFLGDAVKQLVYDGIVAPRWIGTSGRFWYVKDGPSGKEFLIADPAQNTRTAAFDHEKLAAAAAASPAARIRPAALPFDRLRFRDNDRTLYAEGGGLAVNCDLTAYTCARTAVLFDDDGQETGPNRPFAEGDPPPRADVPSPDGTHTAFVVNHNLWVRNLKTGETIQLSRDGEHHYDYATPLPNPTLMLQQGKEDVVQTPAVFWSPDSTRIATYVMDQRNFPRLTMTLSAPKISSGRNISATPIRCRSISTCPPSKLVIFDVPKRKQTFVAARPLDAALLRWTARRLGRRQPPLHVPRDRARLRARPAARRRRRDRRQPRHHR